MREERRGNPVKPRHPAAPKGHPPMDHQSTLLPCPDPSTISGAMYSMVPMKLLVRWCSSVKALARPKSVSWTWPSLHGTGGGIRWQCKAQ